MGDYTANIIQLNEDDPTTVATALGDKAPAGFGFGERLVEIRAESADESYETFCAKIDAYAATLPNVTAALIIAYPPAIYTLHALSLAVIIKSNADYIVLRNLAWEDWRGYGWQMIRCKTSQQSPSVWMPFEWVNPPLNLGVEYRTTERYQGKPVYVQSINFGTLPNASSKSINHNIQNYGGVVSYTGRMSYYNLIGHPGVDGITIAGGTITIVTNANLSTQSAIITLKYTKTTD